MQLVENRELRIGKLKIVGNKYISLGTYHSFSLSYGEVWKCTARSY